MPQPYKTIAKSGEVPSVVGGVLWPDDVNEIFWLYGGEFDVNPKKDLQLWGFDTRLNRWNLSTNPSITGSDIKRTSYGAGATLSGKGYHCECALTVRYIVLEQTTDNYICRLWIPEFQNDALLERWSCSEQQLDRI